MQNIIESEGLKEHPIEASLYYLRSSFKDKIVYRLLSVAFSCGLRDLREATGLSESIDKGETFRETFNGSIEENPMIKLVKYLRNIGPETARKFLGYSFGKNADEKIEFVPNGKEISCLLSDIIFNEWFRPKTPLSTEELETRVEEMNRVFNFGKVSIKETPYLDEAVDARHEPISCEYSREKMTSIIFNDDWRISKLVDKCSEEASRKLNPIVQKGLIRRLGDYLNQRFLPLISLPEIFSEVRIPLETKRDNLGYHFEYFVSHFSSSLIKQIMINSRSDFERTIRGDSKGGIWDDGSDIYEHYYSDIVARDIGDDLGNYARYLITKDLIPSKERYCLAENLFNFYKQGYWFAGFSKEDDGSKRAVFWHLK